MLINTGFKKIDASGSLLAYEFFDIPEFSPKRIYFLTDIKPNSKRGFHAHKKLVQRVVAIKGSFKVLLDDGENRKIFELDNPMKSLLIKPKVWRELYEFTEDAVCLVLASEKYDESDYIRSYSVFKKYLLLNKEND